MHAASFSPRGAVPKAKIGHFRWERRTASKELAGVLAGPPERLDVFVRPTGPPLSRLGHAHGLILVARRGVEDEYLSKKWRRH